MHAPAERAAPLEQLGAVLRKTAAEARAMVGKVRAPQRWSHTQDLVRNNVCLTEAAVAEALARCRGAAMIVYPMGLPPHEEAEAILTDTEELAGTQVCFVAVRGRC
jgi:hypothetical protein